MTRRRIARPDLVPPGGRSIRDVLLAVGAPPNVAEVEAEIGLRRALDVIISSDPCMVRPLPRVRRLLTVHNY